MPNDLQTTSRSSSLSSGEGVGGESSRSGGSDLSSSPRSRLKSGAEWECVELLRSGPNPRWRCKSCGTDYTGAPRRIAQHILGAGGVGQIKPCPRPLQEYVKLMTDLMALDTESGRLVKKAKVEEGVGGNGAAAGGVGGAGSPGKPQRRKPRGQPVTSGVGGGGHSPELFEVFVAKEDFKFSSSHFVAFDGFRERLHGHNYSCSVRLKGEVCEDGYVVDFGVVKKSMRKLCKEMNERFLCPMESDALKITLTGAQVVIVCQDGATFVLPRDDCALLPLVHSTAEELAHHLFARLLREFSLPYLHSRGVTDMEVSVAELPQQEATYRGKIPLTEEMIRDPPFRGARRVEGCFSREEDDFGGGGGGGGGSSSNVHYSGSSSGGGGGGGGGGSGGGGGGGAGGAMGGLGINGGSLGINTNQLHQQAYPYGVLLGDGGWASGAAGGSVGGSGGRMRLGGAGGGSGGGGGGGALTGPGGSDMLLPGLRSSNVGTSQGFAPGPAGGGSGGLGLGQELPLGAGSRGM